MPIGLYIPIWIDKTTLAVVRLLCNLYATIDDQLFLSELQPMAKALATFRFAVDEW